MKKIFFISIFATALLFACNSASSDPHTHEDGTAHSDCDHEHEKAAHAEQETFEVKENGSEGDCKHDSINESGEQEHHHHEGDDHEHSH